jgi:uncharacterized protein (TIRG00374 family)
VSPRESAAPDRISTSSAGTARIVVGFTITAVVLVAGVRLVDWSRTLSALQRLPLHAVATFVGLNALSLVLFAVRWRCLISSQRPPTLRRSFDVLAVGLLANAVLPGRPGDVIRAALLKRQGVTRFSAGLASIVLERLVDIVFICLLGSVLAFAVALPTPVQLAIKLFAAGAAGLLVVLAVVHRKAGLFTTLAASAGALPVGRRLAAAPLGMLGRFAAALAVLRDPRRISAVALLTAGSWAVLVLAILALLRGFAITAPPAAAVLIVVTTNLGAAIPSSPGSIGVYHLLAVAALSVWGVDQPSAVAFAVVAHFLSIALHVTCGLTAAWREGLGFTGMSSLASRTSDAAGDKEFLHFVAEREKG